MRVGGDVDVNKDDDDHVNCTGGASNGRVWHYVGSCAGDLISNPGGLVHGPYTGLVRWGVDS